VSDNTITCWKNLSICARIREVKSS